MHISSHTWEEKEVCNLYEQTWEISTDEIHYGWLSPGENSLRLLADIPEGSKTLDVGCGMGENVVALNGMKMDAYGLDISRHMVRKARNKLRDHGVESTQYGLRKRIRRCDAREITQNFREQFDAVPGSQAVSVPLS
jgi:ubiquinone/menaquinone biosynthesis C-methylase UbiE